jgi:hypothetical protein
MVGLDSETFVERALGVSNEEEAMQLLKDIKLVGCAQELVLCRADGNVRLSCATLYTTSSKEMHELESDLRPHLDALCVCLACLEMCDTNSAVDASICSTRCKECDAAEAVCPACIAIGYDTHEAHLRPCRACRTEGKHCDRVHILGFGMDNVATQFAWQKERSVAFDAGNELALPFPDIGHLLTNARATAVREWVLFDGHLTNMRVMLTLVQCGILVLKKGDIVPRDRTEHASLERVLKSLPQVPPNEPILATIHPDSVVRGAGKSGPIQIRHIASTITNLDLVATTNAVFLQVKSSSAERIPILIDGKDVPDPGGLTSHGNLAIISSGKCLFYFTLKISNAALKRVKPIQIALSVPQEHKRFEDVHLATASLGVACDMRTVWRMEFDRSKPSATLIPLWRVGQGSSKEVRCVASSQDLALVAVGTSEGLVLITKAASDHWPRFTEVTGIACMMTASEACVFVRDTNGLWELRLEVAVEGPWRSISCGLLIQSTTDVMRDGTRLECTIGRHGGVSLQERSLLLADPQFKALRVLTNTAGVKNFLTGLVRLRLGGGLDKDVQTLSEARKSMADALQSFEWHIANATERAALLHCSPDGLLALNGALSPTFRAAIHLYDRSQERLLPALRAVGAEALIESVLPRSFSEEHCEVFFSMCTRKSHVAQTPEEYGFATAANRQFEAFRAGNIGINAPQPTGFYRELKNRSTMSPFITLELPRRTKEKKAWDPDVMRHREAGMSRFRILFAARDRVQRVRRSFHTSRLGVKPRSMQLIFAPAESVDDYEHDRKSAHAAALDTVAPRGSSKSGETIEARRGAVVAVVAGLPGDKYWFFELDDNVIRNESTWVTKRMSGKYLEHSGSPNTYIYGEKAMLSVSCLICEVDVEYNTDDPTVTLIEISADTMEQLDREVAELKRPREEERSAADSEQASQAAGHADGSGKRSRNGRPLRAPGSLNGYET